jgi:hypothetical protein
VKFGRFVGLAKRACASPVWDAVHGGSAPLRPAPPKPSLRSPRINLELRKDAFPGLSIDEC